MIQLASVHPGHLWTRRRGYPAHAGVGNDRDKLVSVNPLATWRRGEQAFVLRRAVRADVAGIVELLADDELGATRDGGPGTDFATYHHAFAAIDADPAQLLLVVVSEDDDVVGTMQLTFIPGMARRGALRAQIEAVRVAATQRNHGLGEAMFTWATAEARRRGCALVQLTTDKTRANAHRFYQRLGFVASHEGLKLQL